MALRSMLLARLAAAISKSNPLSCLPTCAAITRPLLSRNSGNCEQRATYIRYSRDHSWGYEAYNGPHTWTRFAPEASGERQSPINIDTQRAQYDPSLETPYLGGEAREFMAGAGPLRYLGGALPGARAALFNYARGFRLEQPNDLPIWKLLPAAVLTGGPLGSRRYKFWQLHAHWGASDGWGSEHAVDGRYHSCELHIVHYDTRYASPADALEFSDGITVLGVFIDSMPADADSYEFADFGHHVSEETIGQYTKIFDNINQCVHYPEQNGVVDPVVVEKLLPGHQHKYFTYSGSLTTPPCKECVNWIVFQQPILLPAKHFAEMRRLSRLPQTAYVEEAPEVELEDGAEELEHVLYKVDVANPRKHHHARGHDDDYCCRIVDNYRPVCPIGDRLVRSSFPLSAGAAHPFPHDLQHAGDLSRGPNQPPMPHFFKPSSTS